MKTNVEKWQLCLEVLNNFLGAVAWQTEDERGAAIEFYNVLAVDFGEPTRRDLEDFIEIAKSTFPTVPTFDASRAAVVKGIVATLNLYYESVRESK